MNTLISKRCVPCEGNTPPLSTEEIEKLLPQIRGWKVIEGKILRRDFSFTNFKEAIAFVQSVADAAESEGHHPDILVHGWNKVRLELSTRAIGGLSENDFILAAKIDNF